MAVIEMRPVAREAAGKVESFEGLNSVGRIRLGGEEVRLIRYVFSDWASAGGVHTATMYEATVEYLSAGGEREGGGKTKKRAAAGAEASDVPIPGAPAAGAEQDGDGLRPDVDVEEFLLDRTRKRMGLKRGSSRRRATVSRAERRRRKWAKQDAELEGSLRVMRVGGGDSGAKRRAPLFAPEQWAELSTADERFGRDKYGFRVGDGRAYGECEKILRCWRAMGVMASTRRGSFSLIVLHALYGGLPPGLPRQGLWRPALDLEYRRVCRYAPSGGGGAHAIERLVAVDTKRREGESQQACELRVGAERAQSYGVLAKVARECEAIIVAAAGDYRAAWRLA